MDIKRIWKCFWLIRTWCVELNHRYSSFHCDWAAFWQIINGFIISSYVTFVFLFIYMHVYRWCFLCAVYLNLKLKFCFCSKVISCVGVLQFMWEIQVKPPPAPPPRRPPASPQYRSSSRASTTSKSVVGRGLTLRFWQRAETREDLAAETRIQSGVL